MIRFNPQEVERAIACGVLTAEQVAPPVDIREGELLRLVIAVARGLGWRVAHFRPALAKSGRWMTPVQGDGIGFPDLVMVKGQRLIFMELKATTGRLRPEQRAWMDALDAVPGVTCAVVRPANWPTLVRLLEEG